MARSSDAVLEMFSLACGDIRIGLLKYPETTMAEKRGNNTPHPSSCDQRYGHTLHDVF